MPAGTAAVATPPAGPDRLSAFPAPPAFTGARAGFENVGHFRLDAHGVVQTNIGAPQGYVYLPTNIGRYTMALYAAWRAGDDSALAPMIANARWLEKAARVVSVPGGPRFVVFPLPMPMPPFHIPAGARSALTAGDAMAALYATSLVTHDANMAWLAQQILPGFTVTVQQGGYKVTLGRSAAWFEEYAFPGVQPPRVLNGHIFAVIALKWYGQQTGNTTALHLAQLGVNGLVQSVHLYTDHPISAYDLEQRGKICGYHYGDITLLRYFYSITHLKVFKYYADLWSRETC